jgi:hypothetical protein
VIGSGALWKIEIRLRGSQIFIDTEIKMRSAPKERHLGITAADVQSS